MCWIARKFPEICNVEYFNGPQRARIHDLRSLSRLSDLGMLPLTVERRDSKPQEDLVGRTYYRRPNAESSADVFDRVKQPLSLWHLSPSVWVCAWD